MKKILILMGRYLPGHKDGGPLRTIINLTDALGDEYDFYIACLDRDHGDTEPYVGIAYNEWNRVGKANVWYQPVEIGFNKEVIITLAEGMDLIYSCGFYGDYGRNLLMLHKKKKLQGIPVVVASMGTFSPGALLHKTLKKKTFISLFKLLGFFKSITWSVTSKLEAQDLKNNIGKKAEYVIAEDLPRSNVPGIGDRDLSANSIVFLSRICPQKNLLGAIRAVDHLHEECTFDIYGPREDIEYWNACEKELQKLPSNINWHYYGDVPTDNVQWTLSRYNIFLFPTMGENYGHVIFEALSVGCIPVISDQTPWREIKEVGSVLPLNDDMAHFSSVISSILEETTEEKERRASLAVKIAESKVEKNKKETGYRKIFG